MASPIADWRTLAASKRSAVANKIPSDWRLPSSQTAQYVETSTSSVLDVPRTCGLLTEKELELTENYDATALVEMMVKGEVKSIEVVTAFCKRAAIAQQCVNCLTEIMFDEALARARQCDDYLEREGKTMGPLHGLPISLKVQFTLPRFPKEHRWLMIGCNRTRSTSKALKLPSATSPIYPTHQHHRIATSSTFSSMPAPSFT